MDQIFRDAENRRGEIMGIFDLQTIMLVYSICVVALIIVIHHDLVDIADTIDANTEEMEGLRRDVQTLYVQICKESLKKEGKL